MNISLSEEVLKGLPSPDDNGLVRVSVALRVSREGKASVVEVNDVPTGEEHGEEKSDDESLEAATSDMPNPEDIASQIVGG